MEFLVDTMATGRSNPTIRSFAMAVIITLLITFLISVNTKLFARGYEGIRDITIASAHRMMQRSGNAF
jgi:hypothetical protein